MEPTDDTGVDVAVDEIADAVLTASRLLVALSARSIASIDETITLPQFRVLVVLDTTGPSNLATLADRLAVRPSTMTRMTERLVQAGLVHRAASASSRRELEVSLTGLGRRVVTQATARRRAEITRVLQQMDPVERDALGRVLSSFAAAGGEPEVLTMPEVNWV